jgi:glycosyltransferase involved in cell wall biosynthesis
VHILFLTDNFPPEVNAPASRTHEHAREWVKLGHRVTVVTCVPNFPKGEVFEGYSNKAWQEEQVDGIRVIRVWSYVSANEGFVRRIADYVSFMTTGTIAGMFVRDADVIVGTSPQFFTAVAAWMLSTIRRIPWVFELRDLWPETIEAVGAVGNRTVLARVEDFAFFLYRKADAVVSVTYSFKDKLVRRGIDARKIAVVTNGVDSNQFSPRPKDLELVRRLGLEGRFVAGYIGTHGMCQALDTLLDAAAELRNEPFAFLLLGDGARKQELQARAMKLGLKNIFFVDTVSKADVVRFWSILDVSVIHLQRSDVFKTVIPSKLFESMGMGLPVLHGVEGESARIVEGCQAGVLFEPENSLALVAALRKLRSDGELLACLGAASAASAAKFDRRNLAIRMGGLLEDVVARRVGGKGWE